MANKQDHINYWLDSASESWKDAQALISSGRYLAALFYWHLCVEKLLKANWVKDNLADFPPRTHNLILLEQQTQLNLSEEMIGLLKIMSLWNIEGRYPEMQTDSYKIATKEYIVEKKELVLALKICLLEKLQ